MKHKCNQSLFENSKITNYIISQSVTATALEMSFLNSHKMVKNDIQNNTYLEPIPYSPTYKNFIKNNSDNLKTSFTQTT